MENNLWRLKKLKHLNWFWPIKLKVVCCSLKYSVNCSVEGIPGGGGMPEDCSENAGKTALSIFIGLLDNVDAEIADSETDQLLVS